MSESTETKATRFFEKDVDLNDRKSMTEYIENYMTYWVMNSWNGLQAFAHCVKIYDIGLTPEQEKKAFDLIDPNVNTYQLRNDIHWLMREYNKENGNEAFFNGRSGGYLVMYTKQNGKYGDKTDIDLDEAKDSELRELCEELIRFDRLCDDVRDTFIDYIEHASIEDKEVVTTVRTLVHD